MPKNSTSIYYAMIVVLLLSGCSTKHWTAKDWFENGQSLSEEGKYREAAEAYTHAIEKDPGNALAYYNRGRVRTTLGNYKQALDDFTKMLSLGDMRIPEREAYRAIGLAYLRMDKFDESLNASKKALGKTRDDTGLLVNIAAAYLGLNQTEKATEAASVAYAIDPAGLEVLNVLGEIAVAKKEYRKAADLFERAAERWASTPAMSWNAALTFERIKEYGKAEKFANRYIEREPDVTAHKKAYDLIDRVRKAPVKGAAGS